jgi:hypothetical protein
MFHARPFHARKLPETEIWKMHSHHDVAKFTSHENIEKRNPFPAWAEKILARKKTPEAVVTVATVLLYVVLFHAFSHGIQTQTIVGF